MSLSQNLYLRNLRTVHKEHAIKLSYQVKMFNILNNTARNLDNTEAACGFRWNQMFLKSKIWSEVPLKFSKILEKHLWRSSCWSKPPGFSQQLYQKWNSLTSISQGARPLPRNTYYSNEHPPVSASNDIRTIKIYVLYRDTNICFWVVYLHKI